MIYYKFLHKPDFLMRLNVSKGNFVELFYPNNGSEESYCYAEIEENDFRDFTDYFGADGEMLNPDTPDWPGSMESIESDRVGNFSSIRFPNA